MNDSCNTKDKLIECLSKVDKEFVSFFESNDGIVHINVKSFSALLDINFMDVESILSNEMRMQATVGDIFTYIGDDCTAVLQYVY